jgi:flagellar biosynthesis/type III secretory pathway M-ring protein FliF/YscJ
MVEEPSAAMPMMPELSDVDKANAQFEQLRGKVADLVEEDPRRAAGLVRRWMTKENY